jgi:hypothetical protein
MRRTFGWILIVLSALSVVQTVRLAWLFERGGAAFDEATVRSSPVNFAGRTITVSDDQPHTQDTIDSRTEFDGVITVELDGHPYGTPSRAEVRRALDDLGRYFGWVDVWTFRSRESGETTLWMGRRLQPARGATPLFEITTIDEKGRVNADTLRAWRLGFDYRHYRTTQFIRSGTWATMPLTLELAGFVPLTLLVFPIGSAIAGVMMISPKRQKR